MLITVLGKYGPYPAAGGGTSSYLVRGTQTAILLDCGSGAIGRVQQHLAIKNLNAVVLSHLHNDHMSDLLPLCYYLQGKNEPIDLYLPFTDCPQFEFLAGLECFHLMQITDGETVTIGELRLTFAKMQHPLEDFSVRVSEENRSLWYSGDTAFCPQILSAAAGADLLLLDTGKAEGTSAPHLSLSEAAFIGKSVNARIIATHLNPTLEYKSSSAEITIAEEGKTYSV